MKKTTIVWLIILSIFFASCSANSASDSGAEKPGTASEETGAFLISNMADAKSRDEVGSALKANLSAGNVDRFLEGVEDYNETIKRTSLTEGFEEKAPEYDMSRISSLWAGAKGNFIGTNCRINAFLLLKDDVGSEKGEIDDKLLFLDNDANETGKIFTEEEAEQFRWLFSRVKTESTKDIRVHAEKMQEHFSHVRFNEKARMISVIVHDNLDGDYLFVGHVGVLTENQGEYIFVEKLSFEEPYQAIKFRQREDCYKYLFDKYEHYSDETTAKPFIMENGEWKYGEDGVVGQ